MINLRPLEPELQAPPFLLRPWRVADVPALVEAGADDELRRWTSTSVDDADGGLRYVETQRRGWETGERYAFAVLEAGQLVGHVVLKGAGGGAVSAEVGYWTAAHARGRSVATRALGALTDWAFATFGPAGLARLELVHRVDNVASCRVAEKSGFAYARTLPERAGYAGHLHVRGPGVSRRHRRGDREVMTSAPVAMSAPAVMTPHRERQDMTDQHDCADSSDPALSQEPTEATDAAEPTDPTDSTEPMDPTESTDPTDPMESTESLDQRESAEAMLRS